MTRMDRNDPGYFSKALRRLIWSDGLGLKPIKKEMKMFSWPITDLFKFLVRWVANSATVNSVSLRMRLFLTMCSRLFLDCWKETWTWQRVFFRVCSSWDFHVKLLSNLMPKYLTVLCHSTGWPWTKIFTERDFLTLFLKHIASELFSSIWSLQRSYHGSGAGRRFMIPGGQCLRVGPGEIKAMLKDFRNKNVLVEYYTISNNFV